MKRCLSRTSISYLLNDSDTETIQQEESVPKRFCAKDEKKNNFTIKVERTQDLDCSICLKLLYQPITTFCGHTFCKGCLGQSFEVNRTCPICRSCLDEEPLTCSVSVVIQNIIQNCFQEEYKERHSEFIKEIHQFPLMPLLTYFPVLPNETFSIRMSHPHQRLMMRRIMLGDQKLGVAGVGVGGSMMKIGCECEVIDLISQPEGSFFVTLVGRNRIKIIESSEVDGYTVGKVEYLYDETDSTLNLSKKEVPDEKQKENNKKEKSITEIVEEVKELIGVWIEKVQTLKNRRLSIIIDNAGPMPENDISSFSYWACSLLPLTEIDKDYFLTNLSVRDRLLKLVVLLKTRSPEKSCFI